MPCVMKKVSIANIQPNYSFPKSLYLEGAITKDYRAKRPRKMPFERMFHSVNVKNKELITHSSITKSKEMKVRKFIKSTFQSNESLSVDSYGRPN
jgi:hypothetical protein